LFAAFAAAFLLFAANQALSLKFVTPDDLGGSIYVLRVLGYVIILWAIIEKNLGKGANRER
jgi:hypothetical protein